MSKYGRQSNERGRRIDLLMIKSKVRIALFFFTKVEIEREFVSYSIEDELKKWSSSNGITFEVKEIERPIYIRGHSFYDTHSTRHCKILSFSK